MKLRILILPVLIASLAVGFIVYRDMGMAEGMDATEEINVSSSAEIKVPEDIYYTKYVDSVGFSHQKHALELQFACSTCHTGIFQMDAHNVESQPDFNMAGLAKGKYCGTCHSSEHDMAFATDSQCARCHRGVKGLEKVEMTGSQESQ